MLRMQALLECYYIEWKVHNWESEIIFCRKVISKEPHCLVLVKIWGRLNCKISKLGETISKCGLLFTRNLSSHNLKSLTLDKTSQQSIDLQHLLYWMKLHRNYFYVTVIQVRGLTSYKAIIPALIHYLLHMELPVILWTFS